jgi:hypothetical protein
MRFFLSIDRELCIDSMSYRHVSDWAARQKKFVSIGLPDPHLKLAIEDSWYSNALGKLILGESRYRSPDPSRYMIQSKHRVTELGRELKQPEVVLWNMHLFDGIYLPPAVHFSRKRNGPRRKLAIDNGWRDHQLQDCFCLGSV